jgi:hypothetical protein
MIDHNHNRACELSKAKHDKNIIYNHVRFAFGEPFGVHHTIKIKII